MSFTKEMVYVFCKVLLVHCLDSLSGFIGRIEGKASSARFNHRLVIETVIEMISITVIENDKLLLARFGNKLFSQGSGIWLFSIREFHKQGSFIHDV